ncbi:MULTISPECIES: hypothetical protein [unclassified Leeuwenhoekiella]|uniref:hypothetical protein n=1 Tax=unclassified Leeuwenhoekiella TaxID=2615029 RepID=UPI0025C42177|nr:MULTISPECIES: hypothetical protein [unclassified Leeuwenhoekiella]|tara:strand:+ start:16596 stop:16763 length:168 start_codon:yes stop_codon:yes gene_type:complete
MKKSVFAILTVFLIMSTFACNPEKFEEEIIAPQACCEEEPTVPPPPPPVPNDSIQ